jgi:membrane fusion protein, multidrug efflux system
MSRRLALTALLLAAGAVALGCSKGENKKPADQTAERPSVAVETARAEKTDLNEGIEVIGSLGYKFGADVKSEFSGIVTDVYVNEWVRVRKGDPLARIDTREMEIIQQKAYAAIEAAKAGLLQAEVGANRANREYERQLKLKEVGLVTQQAFDDGLTEKEAAAARIAAARAQVRVAEEELEHSRTRLSKTTIRAPRDGIVSQRGVNVGDMVGEMGSQRLMFRIIDPRVLELTVTIPSPEMSSVRVGQSLSFTSDAVPGRTFSGKVMFINPVVTEADRSVKVIAEVDNGREELKGGLFAKGRILTGRRASVLRIPRPALLNLDLTAKKGDVFVVDGDRARRKSVQTGAVMGDFMEITAGLAAGEPVVVRGGFNLRDGDRVTVAPAAGG